MFIMKTLKEIVIESKLHIHHPENLKVNQNYGTDKGGPKSYIEKFYDEKFKNYQEKDITIVEIGVRAGASLKLWSEYFSKNSKIFGLDSLIEPNTYSIPVNQEWVSSKNVEYIIGDAYTEETSNKFDKIDILIDDGPHTQASHIKLLQLYINKMNKGGIIVIEDICYDAKSLREYIPEHLKKNYYICDYGGYDNRLVVIEGF